MKRKESRPLGEYLPAVSWVDACETIVEMARGIMRDALGAQWNVAAQGSFVQGLQLVGSDLDLVVLDGTDRWKHLNRRRNAEELELAVRALCRAGYHGFRVSVIRKIYSARVPLARLRISLDSHVVEVDLCFGDSSRGSCDVFVRNLISAETQCMHFALAMKIWATKRGICQTHTGGISCFAVVLMAIFHHRRRAHHSGIAALTNSFMHFFQALSDEFSVKLENMRLTQNNSGDFFHVAVPCREGENAARCLTRNVWQRTVLPEILRAVVICTAASTDNLESLVERLVSQHVSHAEMAKVKLQKDIVYDEEDVLDSSVDEYDSESSSSLLNFSKKHCQGKTVADPAIKSIQTINPVASAVLTILECSECDYSCLTSSALTNHKFAVHKYRPEDRSSVAKRGRSHK